MKNKNKTKKKGGILYLTLDNIDKPIPRKSATRK